MALKIMAYEMEKINGITKKSKREIKMMEDSAFTALFVIPAIARFQTPATDQLADFLVEEWQEKFPEKSDSAGEILKKSMQVLKKRGASLKPYSEDCVV